MQSHGFKGTQNDAKQPKEVSAKGNTKQPGRDAK